MSKYIISINEYFTKTEPVTMLIIAENKADAYIEAIKMYLKYLDDEGIDFDNDRPAQDLEFKVVIYNIDELSENKIIKYLYDY